MISTLIRGNLPQESKPNTEKHKQSGSFIFFNDREIQISSKEKELLKYFKTNQLVLRMLTGQLDSWFKDLSNKDSKPQSNSQSLAAKAEEAAKSCEGGLMGMKPPLPIKSEKILKEISH